MATSNLINHRTSNEQDHYLSRYVQQGQIRVITERTLEPFSKISSVFFTTTSHWIDPLSYVRKDIFATMADEHLHVFRARWLMPAIVTQASLSGTLAWLLLDDVPGAENPNRSSHKMIGREREREKERDGDK
ncbi:MAG: hypothetical protein M1830_008627 [Pleopsidium flavum]|nr:MAG: hypothetical protein M1830_008627 [Pleopsidium flavum]